MFNGIVEKIAHVVGVADSPMFRRLTLGLDWDDLRGGQSIAVNGCCLTIAEFGNGRVGFDVITETLEKTNLGVLEVGDAVNVERAMRVNDRIDGHFVQGHVDGTARLVEIVNNQREVRLVIEPPPDLMKYIVGKGSVAIDGVSLTIAAVNGRYFEVALIPTTIAATTLATQQPDWRYNLETDILARTVISWMERQS